MALNYLSFRLRSFRLHGIHSPFVFDLHQNVILHQGQYYAFSAIEELRRHLLLDQRKIEITDFGAGSKIRKSRMRSVRDLARNSAKSPRLAQLLFRLVNHVQPRTILEVGTSLGITAAYLAAAAPKAQVLTLEGCPQTAAVARENLALLGFRHVALVEGEFSSTLPQVLQGLPSVDVVFLDGNHRYAPTMAYFEACLVKRTEHSVFVVDDIYWSPEMEKAWQEICQHPAVTISVDLFWLGLIFFRTNQPKQHFSIHTDP